MQTTALTVINLRFHRSGSRRRRGFTMVEILITIGVIVLLVGIGVIAYRGLDKMASERTTHVALDNANAMIAEYEHGGQLVNLTVYDPVNGSMGTSSGLSPLARSKNHF